MDAASAPTVSPPADHGALARQVGAAQLLCFPVLLVDADRVVLLLLAGWLLPLAADALAGTDGVMGTARDGPFDGDSHRFFRRSNSAKDAAAWCAELRISVLLEDAHLQCGSSITIAPRTELALIQTIELHDRPLLHGPN